MISRVCIYTIVLLTMVTDAVTNVAMAARRRPAGQILQLSGDVLIKPQGQSAFRRPQPGHTLRAGDLLMVRPGAVAMVQCPNGLPIVAPADGNTRGFGQICPTITASARCGDGAPQYQTYSATSGRDPNQLYIISPRRTIIANTNPSFVWNAANRSASYQIKLHQVPWLTRIPLPNGRLTNQISYPTTARDPSLDPGAYRLVVEAYNNTSLLSRQEKPLTIATLPTVARKLSLSWDTVPNVSYYLVSLERQESFWQTQTNNTKAAYPGNLPPGRYNLQVSDNTAGGNRDQQQFLAQDFSDAGNELNKAKTDLIRLNNLTQLANQPLSPVAKQLASAQIFADNYLLGSAIAQLASMVNRGDQTIAVYRQLGELHRQIGLTAIATNYYHQALELARKQSNIDEQQQLQAELTNGTVEGDEVLCR